MNVGLSIDTRDAGCGLSLASPRLENDQSPLIARFLASSDEDQTQLEEGFAAFLVEEGIIDQAVSDRARSAVRNTGERFDRVLTKLGLVSEINLTAALSEYFSVQLVAPNDIPMEPVASDIIDVEFIRQNRILPLGIDATALTVGVVDLFNTESVSALEYFTEKAIKLRVFSPVDFEKAFSALYAQNLTGSRSPGAFEASELDIQRLRDMASEAPVIRLVNQIIIDAVEARASDIHVEPNIAQVFIRYRIDGMLRTAQALESTLRAAVTSRIKIMAKLDIAERRMPQDGRIKISVRGIEVDIRVSTIPTVFGESVVMRILDRSRVELDFGKLGFLSDHVSALHRLIQEPNGILLVTGPTGSGKTTTLYTALKLLNSEERKVFSVEDPIEYQLAGINQVQVQAEIGLDFPHALRAILRQDPDIIMIGEIRDLETARIAIQSSLTGHLVLSTLHTNNAAAAITRLIDIGVESYLLASTVKGVVAQRLIRKLCPYCACKHNAADHWAAELVRTAPGIEADGLPAIRMPQGCNECGHTGYLGRSIIGEILLVDEKIQKLILSKAMDGQISSLACEGGMTTMYEAGAGMIWRGETTVEEVLRVTRIG